MCLPTHFRNDMPDIKTVNGMRLLDSNSQLNVFFKTVIGQNFTISSQVRILGPQIHCDPQLIRYALDRCC